jgi:hypothetical protein
MATQPTLASNLASSPRPAEGYSKEIFGQADATLLPVGITEVGQAQLATNLTVSGSGNTFVELFSAMLVELRQMNAYLAAMREPTMSAEGTKLRITA